MADSNLPDYILNARSQAENSATAANDFAVASATIPDQLKKAVSDAFSANQDLINERSKSFATMLSAPDVAESRFGTKTTDGAVNQNYIWNPFERNQAISQFTSNATIPFTSQNYLLGLVRGSGADMINAGTRAFQAATTAKQGEVQIKRQSYTDALNEFLQTEDLKLKQAQEARLGATTGQKKGWQIGDQTFYLTDSEAMDAYLNLQKQANPTISSAEKLQINAAKDSLKMVKTLKDEYAKVQKQGLTAGKGSEGLGRFVAGAKGTLAAFTQTSKEAAAYEKSKSAFLSKLARAAGEKGVLTNQDVERIGKALPSFSDTPDTVNEGWMMLESILTPIASYGSNTMTTFKSLGTEINGVNATDLLNSNDWRMNL